MVILELGTIEFDTNTEIVETLNEIANTIDDGYRRGITCGGVSWGLKGYEEYDAEFDDEEID